MWGHFQDELMWRIMCGYHSIVRHNRPMLRLSISDTPHCLDDQRHPIWGRGRGESEGRELGREKVRLFVGK